MTQDSEMPYNILFLGTGNAGRSIIAEALVNHWGGGRFHGFSAGSHPAGQLDATALLLLRQLGVPTGHLRSKEWTEFVAPGAPVMDFVFTLCDGAAQQAWPAWPGDPVSAHWSLPEPQLAVDSTALQMAAYREVFGMIERRVKILLSLRLRFQPRHRVQAVLGGINGIAQETPAVAAA